MKIEVCSVGGYSEVGKNMTAVKAGEDVVILDSGFYLPKVVSFEERGGDRRTLTAKKLLHIGAIPDYRVLDSWKKNIKAIALSHCHLDHIGAVPYICTEVKVPVIGTPFTLEVLKKMNEEDGTLLHKDIVGVDQNKVYEINKNLKLEFVNVTHSTPETSIVVLHTDGGAIVYANDYKLDNHPIIGKKPNYERLREIVKHEGVLLLIANSLYSGTSRKTPSESVAREMLKDVMLGVDNTGHAMFATCFASHIARIKSMIEFGNKLDRKILVFGRSMKKYIDSAESVGICKFSKEVELITYGKQIENMLKKIEKDRDKYLVICTGGQAEPGSVLTKVVKGDLSFNFLPEDHVIFSNKTIPVEPNIENRVKIEKILAKKNVRFFTDIHVSGHGGKEDLRDLIDLLQPKHIIPTHGNEVLLDPAVELAQVMGYKKNDTVHKMHDGEVLRIK